MAKDAKYNELINCKQWRTIRNRWLTRNPYCERCKQDGIYTAAQCVHHTTPVESGRTEDDMEMLAYSEWNLMSLCIKCHSDIHRAERSHSRVAVQERQQDRLVRWKQNNKLRSSSRLKKPGG